MSVLITKKTFFFNGEIFKDMDRYIKLEKIGQGTYGVVHRGVDTKTQELVALKFFKNVDEDEDLSQVIIRELNTLQILKNKENIIQIKDICIESNKLCAVLEYIPTSLKEYIRQNDSNLPSNQIRDIIQQLMNAMLCLNEAGIMHRDLKTDNVLICPNGISKNEKNSVKIIDFGLSRNFASEVETSTEVQTLWYKAPELLLGSKSHDFSIDMWSVGCIFAELVQGFPLFQGDCEIDQLFKIFRVFGTPEKQDNSYLSTMNLFSSNFPKWEPDITSIQAKFNSRFGNNYAFELLQKMLCYNPNHRIKPEEALSYPFFLK